MFRVVRKYNMLFVYVLGVAIHCGLKGTCFATSHAITTTIYEDLLGSQHYNERLLPVCENGGNVTLRLQTALRQIMDLNEKDQILTVNIWVRMKWNDCRLKWNASHYGGIDHFIVPYSAVWIPDITLYDSAAEEEMMPGISEYRATIFNDGTVQYYYPTVLKSVCRVDVTYFPFDTQVCSLQFGSWSHHGLELDMVNTSDSADISTFITHNEWDVVEVPAIRNEIYYKCCKEPYPDVTFKITIKRKPRFYVLTILFPCILTGSIAALGFLLPTESGEKVSLEITVLLSLAVFLLIVSESLPASSENFPYIGMYFASLMSLVSLACLFTVLVLNVNFRGLSGKKVPKWAKTVFIHGCGWILLNKTGRYDMNHDPPQEMKVNGKIHHEQNEDSPKETIVQNVSTKDLLLRSRDPFISIMREQSSTLNRLEEHVTKGSSGSGVDMDEWHVLSQILDRLFFLFYIFATVIVSLVFLLILGSQ